MLKKVDFLIEYEVKAREFEGVCLLKYELERRGYSVGIVNSWYSITHRIPEYIAEVAVISACYTTSTMNYFCGLAKQYRKVVNLQWEQVRANQDEEDKNSLLTIKGEAVHAVHVAWGENTVRHLRQSGVLKKDIVKTGHIAFDFLRDRFQGFYGTSESMRKIYGIPADHKVCLFISSFGYVGIPEEQKEVSRKFGVDDIDSFADFSKKSREKITEWIIRLLNQDEQLEFIYRPHPAEAKSENLIELSNKYQRFHVIFENSVKEWILACDQIYVWYSTAIVEVGLAGKTCGILRPLEMPVGREIVIMNDAKKITKYEDFRQSVLEGEKDFPIPKEILSQYYYDPSPKYSYELLCDKLEEVYKSDQFILKNEPKIERSVKENLFNFIVCSPLHYCIETAGKSKFLKKSHAIQNMCEEIYNEKAHWEKMMAAADEYTFQKEKENYASSFEIWKMCRKINNIIRKNS